MDSSYVVVVFQIFGNFVIDVEFGWVFDQINDGVEINDEGQDVEVIDLGSCLVY